MERSGQWKELACVWGCFHVDVCIFSFLQMWIRSSIRRAADLHVPHFIARHASRGVASLCALARSQYSLFLVMTCDYLEKHPSADLLHLIWLDARNLCHLPPLYFMELNISTSAILTDRVSLIKPPKSSWDVMLCERISMSGVCGTVSHYHFFVGQGSDHGWHHLAAHTRQKSATIMSQLFTVWCWDAFSARTSALVANFRIAAVQASEYRVTWQLLIFLRDIITRCVPGTQNGRDVLWSNLV